MAQFDTGSGIHHSAAYHGFFEGWAESAVPGGGIKRVYAADWISARLDRHQRLCRVILLWVLFLLSAAAFIYGCAAARGASTLWYTVIPSFASVISFVLLACGICCRTAAPEKMTIGEYKTGSLRLIRCALICACLVCVTGAAFITGLMSKAQLGQGWRCPAACGLSGGLLFAVYALERSTVYDRIPNAASLDSSAVMIE